MSFHFKCICEYDATIFENGTQVMYSLDDTKLAILYKNKCLRLFNVNNNFSLTEHIFISNDMKTNNNSLNLNDNFNLNNNNNIKLSLSDDNLPIIRSNFPIHRNIKCFNFSWDSLDLYLHIDDKIIKYNIITREKEILFENVLCQNIISLNENIILLWGSVNDSQHKVSALVGLLHIYNIKTKEYLDTLFYSRKIRLIQYYDKNKFFIHSSDDRLSIYMVTDNKFIMYDYIDDIYFNIINIIKLDNDKFAFIEQDTNGVFIHDCIDKNWSFVIETDNPINIVRIHNFPLILVYKGNNEIELWNYVNSTHLATLNCKTEIHMMNLNRKNLILAHNINEKAYAIYNILAKSAKMIK